ncbi:MULTISPECIES: HAD family hydrolase [Aquitalea]|uniref:Putative hydrolase of the HAD superfamily n=2 Tax=Aquitalea magnusonii TaxID=332411 RepID=A0A318JM81_9NEIS|nr:MULTISPECIES: HAD family phosphatase [Aquitalea]PXX49159.1 putative hydrolase of the HAD superfamily [Aquitalea magnusonii]
MQQTLTPQHAPVLVFDLGGVLVDWNGIDPLMALSQGRLSREQARQFWLHTPEVALLDTGRATPGEFAALMADKLQLGISSAAMLQALDDWLQGPFAGVHALLQQLGQRYRLAVLSNNNALHWGKIEREFDLLQHFEACFASHQIGLRKPDAAAYRHVQDALQVAAGQILFFDDNIECVQAARQAGWQAFHTVGLPAVQQALQAQGLLST